MMGCSSGKLKKEILCGAATPFNGLLRHAAPCSEKPYGGLGGAHRLPDHSTKWLGHIVPQQGRRAAPFRARRLGHRGPLPAGNTTCASELTPEPSDLMERSRGSINAPQTLRRGIARSQVRVKSPPYGRCLCAEISRRLLPPTPAPFRHIDEMIPLRANTAMTKATMSPIGGNPSQLSLAAGR
jgi:hypothetical protein